MQVRPTLIVLSVYAVSLLLKGCITEYQPKIKSLPPALVVEGSITDQPGPYRVKLTRTTDYTNAGINLPETGATVLVSDENGQQELLQESGPGSYQTTATGLRGIAGHRYRLNIVTKDGSRYQSDAELLTAAPPISNVYYKYRADPTALTNENIQGWDVYIDTKDPEAIGDFYRWQWAHYEPITLCQVVDRPNTIPLGIPCCTACWDITRCYTCVNIKSDVAINGNTLSRQFITRVPYTSRSTYYLEVQQQRLSAGGYAFWQSVKGLVQNNGGLFDAAPSTVRGNLRCLSDPNLAVYGFFGATGVSEAYINVDRSDAEGQPNFLLLDYAMGCTTCADNQYRTSTKPRWWKQ